MASRINDFVAQYEQNRQAEGQRMYAPLLNMIDQDIALSKQKEETKRNIDFALSTYGYKPEDIGLTPDNYNIDQNLAIGAINKKYATDQAIQKAKIKQEEEQQKATKLS